MPFLEKADKFILNEDSYTRIFQALRDMVLVTTPPGDLLDINQAGIEALGYSTLAELRQISVDRHYANPQDRLRLGELLNRQGSVKDFETRLVKKNGEEIFVWITANARRDDQGQVIYYEKVIKDVTDRKRLEEEFLEKGRLLERYYWDLKDERDRIEEQAGTLVKIVAEVDEAKQIIEEQNRKVMAELDMAAKLQRSLLPRSFPDLKGFTFASKYIPSNRIGGDFFDVIQFKDGRIGMVIADVSGHGPAAALLMAMFKMSFQMQAQGIPSPSIVLRRLNEEFCRLITTGEYITAFYSILNPTERSVTYAKAGHPYPIVCRGNGGTCEFLDAQGFFIGMFEEAAFEDKETVLTKGDRLLLYTDGVIEARNSEGHSFEIKRLESILAESSHLSCVAVVEEIHRALLQHTQKESFEDDVCMVLMAIEA